MLSDLDNKAETKNVVARKKLIEVALPLDDINKACSREKSIRHGHPSTLHLWWARRPLAAARAVLFAQMVDDPSEHPELFPTEEAQERERERLFSLIKELVRWENTTDEDDVLARARAEIQRNWHNVCSENANHPQASELFDPAHLPIFDDPFAGGGALPLEAQRLGLEAHASDLNPVAVLINKAMIEIPPRFSARPPVNPDARSEKTLVGHQWRGADGLSEDVLYYGRWMRAEAEKRIGHLYPKITVTQKMADSRPDLAFLVGQELTVVAWLWTRTVKSPNPAYRDVDVPLASSFMLSPMSGKEAFVEPMINGKSYHFAVRTGLPKDLDATTSGTKLSGKGGFRCLLSGVPITFEYIRAEAMAGRMSARMMAIVAEGSRGRVYLDPTPEMEDVAMRAHPTWRPEIETFGKCRVNIGLYGLTTWDKLFTERQLLALSTFADLVEEARNKIKADALAAEMSNDDRPFDEGGTGAVSYADAVATYLGFLVSKLADKGSTICTWDMGPASNRTATGRSARVATVRVTFARQALPMTWDFAEVNFFSTSVGGLDTVLNTLTVPLRYLPRNVNAGLSTQCDVATLAPTSDRIISTDPPYYDNIEYADLSDFFYIWLRRSLRAVYPHLFATISAPKEQELVATPHRHGNRQNAESFFLEGMTKAMHQIAGAAHPAYPVTIYYAFKQNETKTEPGTASTGWETFLEAVIRAGFSVSGTWPIRTELGNRMIGRESNALASSIVLVCRAQSEDATAVTRRDFQSALRAELPTAIRHLQRENIAPVDLAQAAIGPGMAIFTRHAKIVDVDGKNLTVRKALELINAVLDEALAEQEADFDSATRCAISWFEQMAFTEGHFGAADVLARAKNTSVSFLVEAGIAQSRSGKFRLLAPHELDPNWDPRTDARRTVWRTLHQIIQALMERGEAGAASIVAEAGSSAQAARELSYRLYVISERRKRAAEAISYNSFVQSWSEILLLSQSNSVEVPLHTDLLGAH